MKKIEKEIKVTRYVAFDGTEFETEYECKCYECSGFGNLLQQIEREILYTNNDGDNFGYAPDGKYYEKWYGIVQKTRTDVRVLNSILEMAGEKPTASGADEGKLLLLGVNLDCNTVREAHLFKIDDFITKISGNTFRAISIIKENEKKEALQK